REQGRFVDDVGQIGADRAGRKTGDVPQIDVLADLHVADVYLEDRFAAIHVGPIDDHGAVKPAGPQEGGIERPGTVGGGHDGDAAIRIEAVHFDEELVKGLLAFVVTADGAAAPRFPQCVQFVDEDD